MTSKDYLSLSVAVLLTLQKMPQKEPLQKAKIGQINIKKLVEQADKAQLAELILEHCKEDKRFQSQVLSELEDSGNQELASIKVFVKASIRSNTYQGYIDDDGCEDIAADLDDALDKARRRIGRGQHGRGLEITQFVLLTGMKLITETESGFYYLNATIAAALETVRLAAQKLAESGEDRLEWVRKLLETALDPVFENWTDWRFDFLEQIAVLADAQNEGEFYGTLDCLRDKHQEKFPDSTTYVQQDKLFRYQLVLAVHGETEARTYLEQNLNVDGIRLCLERLEKEEIVQ